MIGVLYNINVRRKIYMKYEIMLRILFELLSKKCVKASYLADKYEVSTRTVHRYINCLELAGIPIYTIRGNQGGFAIVDTYRLSSTFMTETEFEQTISTLSAIHESVPNQVLESAINKLKAVRKNETSGFNIKSGNLVIDAGPWGDAIGYKSKLSVIQKSLDDNKKLKIRYHDRNGDVTERTIDPHVVVFKQGLWYVFAYCNLRNEFRFFKIGRIESATILSESFTRKDLSDADLPLNFWHENMDTCDVVMEIDKKCLSDVEEWLGIENVKAVGEKFIATAKLPFDNGLVSKIMSFGSGITVVEPQELKEQIKACTKEILENYK
ncbi:MAG: YafY family transcriptional regulator [Clostridiales bacterium]|nr:YafY family transcriptional regulator [Clostridiales bacterium]